MKYLIKEACLVALNKFHFPVVLYTSTLWLFLIHLALLFSRNSEKIRFCHCSRNEDSKSESARGGSSTGKKHFVHRRLRTRIARADCSALGMGIGLE